MFDVPCRFISSKTIGQSAQSLSEMAKLAAAGYDAAPPSSKSSIPPSPLLTPNLANDLNIESSGGSEVPINHKVQLDQRAKAKLLRLAEQKRIYQRALRSSQSGDESEHFTEALKTESIELAKAYAQAIHYVARSKEEDSATYSHRLLEEWIEKCGVPTYKYKYIDGKLKEDEKEINLKDRINQLATNFAPVWAFANGRPVPENIKPLPKSSMPRPVARSFLHVLLSYSDSKLRQKGFRAEQLLIRMAELSWWYPDEFECAPDGKTLALVAKSWSGTTHQDALDHIEVLHKLHDQFVKRKCSGFIAPLDPFLLIHSLKTKSLFQELHKPRQANACRQWLEQLHELVLRYAGVVEDTPGKHNDADEIVLPDTPLDLTGTYMTCLRGYAKASRINTGSGGYKQAFRTLRKMEQLKLILFKQSDRARRAFHIDVPPNAYELVLSSCVAAKNSSSALTLIKEMLKNDRRVLQDAVDTQEKYSRVSEKSFANVFQSLKQDLPSQVNIESAEWLLEELIKFYTHVPKTSAPTLAPVHALLDLYCKWYSNDPTLINRVKIILQKMTDLSVEKGQETLKPDIKCKVMLLKACSLAKEDHYDESLSVARETFALIEKEDKRAKVPLMSDEVYYYYMKALLPRGHSNTQIVDPNRQEFLTLLSKVENPADNESGSDVTSDDVSDETFGNGNVELVELFKTCCKKGLVSANVLNVLRRSIKDEEFKSLVGTGRLADQWVRNVTSAKALYTDGTKGGQGKHAKRKGKSTSDWKKKQVQQKKSQDEKLGKKRVKKAFQELKRKDASVK